MPEITRDRCITPSFSPSTRHRRKLMDGEPPKPNENESFFAKRERDPKDPDVIAGKDLRDPNQWPDNLPGFQETVLEYQDVMRRLVHKLLPIYARALDLP